MNLALQTWTIRKQLREDPDLVLSKIKKNGIDNLEIAGAGDLSIDEFAKLCKNNGLNIISVHQPPLTTGNFSSLMDDIVSYANACSTDKVTVMLDPFERKNVDCYLKYAELCNSAVEILSKHNIQLYYHCFDYDLEIPDNCNKTNVEILLENTANNINLELDTYFLCRINRRINSDIKPLLNQYLPFCDLVHICDINIEGSRLSIGEGIIEWEKVISFIEKTNNAMWFIIENDAKNAFESIVKSLNHLKTVIKK